MAPSVVCGVDDSIGSRIAMAFAARLSRRLDVRLILVHVSQLRPRRDPLGTYAPLPSSPEERQLVEAGRALLEGLAAAEGLHDVSSRSEVGDPAEEIVAVAEEEDAEIVVVGSRGRGPLAAGLLGSVSSWVASHAPTPVAVVPPEAHVPRGAPGTVLCGLDDSDGGRSALRTAARLAERLRARLVLAHAAPRDMPGVSMAPGARYELQSLEVKRGYALLSNIAAEEGLSGPVHKRVGVGTAVDVLERVADEERAEVIVVGSRGRVGLKAAVLGSTSATLAARANRPVLIVRPEAAPTTR